LAAQRPKDLREDRSAEVRVHVLPLELTLFSLAKSSAKQNSLSRSSTESDKRVLLLHENAHRADKCSGTKDTAIAPFQESRLIKDDRICIKKLISAKIEIPARRLQ
jgi:hypothetical protein